MTSELKTDRTKAKPTPKSPQNQPKMTEEQAVQMELIQTKGQEIMDLLDPLTFSVAGMILKTCESMLNAKAQNLISDTVINTVAPKLEVVS